MIRTALVGCVIALGALAACSDRETPSHPAALSVAPAVVPSPDLSPMQPQVASALRSARDHVVSRPGSPSAWGRYGMLLDAHALREDALAAYREARRLAPDEFRWSYLLASTMEFFNAPADEIVAEYQTAARLLPSYPPTFVRMGEVLARHAEPERALRAYQRGVELDASLAFAHRGVGQMSLLLGDPTTAVRSLRHANQLQPDDRSVLVTLARALRQTGAIEESQAMVERSTDAVERLVLPDPIRFEVSEMALTAAACRDRAVRMAAEGDADGALRALDPVRTVDPEDEFFHMTVGNAYARIGHWEQAMHHFQRCVRIEPSMADAYVEMANVSLARRQLESAQRALSSALEIDPDHVRALGAMGAILAARGMEDEAIQAFEQAASKGTLLVRHQAMWATALFRRGDAQSGDRAL